MQIEKIPVRYYFHSGFLWIEGTTVLGFIWLGMIGTALGIRKKSLINVTFIQDRFNKSEKVFVWIQRLLCLAFLFILGYFGIEYTKFGTTVIYNVLKMPYAYQYAAVPTMCICGIVFIIDEIITDAKEGAK